MRAHGPGGICIQKAGAEPPFSFNPSLLVLRVVEVECELGVC